MLLHIAYLALAVCGCLISPFFLCSHLLDLVYRSETLKNVLRAVTFNGQQLLMTVTPIAIVPYTSLLVVFQALLALIIIYIYSIFAFTMLRNNYFQEDFPDERM